MAVSRGGKPVCYILFQFWLEFCNQVFMIINWLATILREACNVPSIVHHLKELERKQSSNRCVSTTHA